MTGLVLTADWGPKAGYAVTPAERRSRHARLGNMVWRSPTAAVGARPDPELLDDHDVIIRNCTCGMRDLYLYVLDQDGSLDLPYNARVPIAIGHEYSGEVGAAVTRVKLGAEPGSVG